MKSTSSTKAAYLRKASLRTKTSRRIFSLAGGMIALLALGMPSAQAQAVANFTGGNDTNNGGVATPAPDTFTGTAGNGWAGAWVSAGNNAGQLTGTVSNTSPLNGGGNYLTLTDSATDSSDSTLTRAYNALPASANETISFDYRLNSSLSNFNTSNDYITVGDAVAGAAGVSNASSFIIRAYGAATGSANALTWALYNGGQNSGSFNTSLFTNSSVALVSGDLYHFTINLHPSTLTYTATITDGSTSYTSGTLGFRTGGALTEALAFNEKNSTGSVLSYSVDSVQIVPEPASVAYLVVGLLGLVAIGRQRSRRALA